MNNSVNNLPSKMEINISPGGLSYYPNSDCRTYTEGELLRHIWRHNSDPTRLWSAYIQGVGPVLMDDAGLIVKVGEA